jgi:DNA-binding transcriptional regulator YbjK
MEETLSAWIEFSLSHHLTENAIFLAERLVAHVRNEDTLHLLASAYLDEGKAERTYHILKNSTSESNRYLAAIAALRTNRFQEGLDLLLPRGEPANLEEVPNGSAGLFILGQLCRHVPYFKLI